MKIAELSIKNPVGLTLLVITLIFLGLVAIRGIPISFWPEFVAPSLIVIAPYPGVASAEIEELIAKPLEEELSTIDGMDEIETTCIEGGCRVFVRFGWGVDFAQAKLDVQDRTNKASARFPREALTPTVLQVQDFLPPGIELGFASEKKGLNEIRDFVEKKLKNRFLRLENVANVQIFGGNEQQVFVKVNPDLLAGYGLTLAQLNTTLMTENMNIPAGKMTTQHRNYFLRTVGKFEQLDDIKNIIVGNMQGVPIYLKDIAQIVFEDKESESIIRLNGKPLVGLAIREKSGGNTVAMVAEVREELEAIEKFLPGDIKVTVIRDQAAFIKNSIRNVLQNAAIGAMLAGIILLIFLGNIKNTLIIALSIPISIVGTFLLIDAFGLSINTISLGGLALGVGMIVDSSIVVLENIFRNLQMKKDANRLQTVVQATQEVGLAVSASNLTSIVVFLPLAFLVGLFAVLLGELALTVVFSLSISVVVALTVVPALSFRLMQTDEKSNFLIRTWQKIFDFITLAYQYSLKWALSHRFLSLLLVTLLMAVTIGILGPKLDVELLPSINEGEFRIELVMAESTQLEVTDKMCKDIEVELKSRPEIAQVYTVVGVLSARGELKPNTATITIGLKPEFLPQLDPVMDTIRKRWNSLPGTRIVVRQTDATEGMRRAAINVRIAGDDLNVLATFGEKALKIVENHPNAVNVISSLQEGLYEFGIQVDRLKASDLGLSLNQIASTIRIANAGLAVTRLSAFGDEYDITLEVDKEKIKSVDKLLDLPLKTMKGEIVPLRAVAGISLGRGPSEIKRLDQQRLVEINADVSGASQRKVAAEIQQAVRQIQLPSNYYLSFGGSSKAIKDSFISLLLALGIAIFLVYVVMGAQFNSFVHPFTIAFTIPLALIGVVIGLYLFGAAMSMNALLGLIMLVGIVVNNGILLIDYIIQLRENGLNKNEAILLGGTTRLRPVLITALTTIFGMLPIALGFGEGGEALQPLGAVVVGGLLTSTFLTLIIIPVVYSILDRQTQKTSE
ncbi:efflux RND transporter permease subunit [candidate division KSB1 bacterium]|nr:efflux RND transporter permease subunit [candidate division KSB1 bacterium]